MDIKATSIGRLLRYAYNHNVGTILFENLNKIKRKKE